MRKHIGMQDKLYRISKILLSIALLSISMVSYSENVDNLRKTIRNGEEYYIYEVKKGDSAYGISKKFGWDQDELLKNNPQASGSLSKGMKLFYPVDLNVTNSNDLNESTTQNHSISSVDSHVVKKGETIYSISRQYDIPLDILYSLNPTAMKGIKAGEIIILAGNNLNTSTNKVNTTSKNSHINDSNLEIKDLSENRASDDLLSEQQYYSDLEVEEEEKPFEGVKIALILDEPTSKKDIDFTRGALIRLSELKEFPFKIDFKVLDGGISANDLTTELDNYEADIIISTADKAFPLFLSDYSLTNNIPIVNVFDLKNDLYEDTETMIQLLPSSQIFNNRIAEKIYSDNRHRKLLGVGDPDANDGIGIDLLNLFGSDGENLTLEEFGAMEPDIMQPVVIYSYATKKEDISDFFNNIEHLAETYPGFDFKIIGRTNWIALTDDYGDKFDTYSVIIPSRVWVDDESAPWKVFLSEYEEMFDATPVRSIPNFAISGYDITKFFIEALIVTEGDFEQLRSFTPSSGIQTDFSLRKVGPQSGYINDMGYLIQFTPEGNRERILAE